MEGKTKKKKVTNPKEQIALQLEDAHTNVLRIERKSQKKKKIYRKNRKKEGKINIRKGRWKESDKMF